MCAALSGQDLHYFQVGVQNIIIVHRTVWFNWTAQVETAEPEEKHVGCAAFPPQGLLQKNGSCVPPEECGCVHLQHQTPGEPPTPVSVPQGSTVTIGCSTWLDSGCLKSTQWSREFLFSALHQSSSLLQEFDCYLCCILHLCSWSLAVFDMFSSSLWLLCSPVFAIMELWSVTPESAKVRKQSNSKSSWLHDGFMLLPVCLAFFQSSSASGPNGPRVPPVHPVARRPKLTVGANWSQSNGGSEPVWTWSLVSRCLERRRRSRANVQDHW